MRQRTKQAANVQKTQTMRPANGNVYRMSIYLERINEQTNAYRYYRVQLLPGFRVLQEWGRLGVAPQHKISIYPDEDTAKAAIEEIREKKLKRGYEEKDASTLGGDCYYCGAGVEQKDGGVMVPYPAHVPFYALDSAGLMSWLAQVRKVGARLGKTPVFIPEGDHAVAFVLSDEKMAPDELNPSEPEQLAFDF